MKLCASYSVFDGAELLKPSLLQIRDNVDYINIGYQKISFNGRKDYPELEDYLYQLKSEKLIDELFLYEPNLKHSGTKNERKKRRLGLQLAKKNKCTHFMAMDVDEFYEKDKFIWAKDYILQNNIQSSAICYMDYVNKPIYQVGWCDFYVPFIFKINFFSLMKRPKNFPVKVDGSKCIYSTKKFHLFSPEQIYIHHMREVRKDISRKILNYPMNNAKDNLHRVEQNSSYLNNLDLFHKGLIEENGEYFLYNIKGKKERVKIVENQFNIEI